MFGLLVTLAVFSGIGGIVCIGMGTNASPVDPYLVGLGIAGIINAIFIGALAGIYSMISEGVEWLRTIANTLTNSNSPAKIATKEEPFNNRITGIDEMTQMETSVLVNASDKADAYRKARARGIVTITNIESI